MVPSVSFSLTYNDNTASVLIYHAMTTSYEDMDEPNTLSPVTYHIQIGSYGDSSNRQIRWNKPHHDAAHLDASVMKSTLIAEEVMGSKALVSHNGYSFNMQPDIIFANRFPESGGVTKMDICWETPLIFQLVLLQIQIQVFMVMMLVKLLFYKMDIIELYSDWFFVSQQLQQ